MLTRNQNQILTATLIARIPTLCRMQKEYGICPYMTITTPGRLLVRESGNQITDIINYATKDGVNYPPIPDLKPAVLGLGAEPVSPEFWELAIFF